MVQQDALTLQQDMQPSIPEAPANSRDLAQSRANETIIGSPAAVAHRAAAHAERLACPPLAHPVDLSEVSGGFSSDGGRYHFLAATSRSMALSSIASASSFFSLAFSSSSTLSRRASDTSSPPYFALHLMGWTALPLTPTLSVSLRRGG